MYYRAGPLSDARAISTGFERERRLASFPRKFEKFDHAAELFFLKAGVKNLRGDQGRTQGVIKEEH
jgi:hypothetical protein